MYNITTCYLFIYLFIYSNFVFATELKHGGIPVEDFARHVKVLHLDGDYKFNQEFEVTIMLFTCIYLFFVLDLFPEAPY